MDFCGSRLKTRIRKLERFGVIRLERSEKIVKKGFPKFRLVYNPEKNIKNEFDIQNLPGK